MGCERKVKYYNVLSVLIVCGSRNKVSHCDNSVFAERPTSADNAAMGSMGMATMRYASQRAIHQTCVRAYGVWCKLASPSVATKTDKKCVCVCIQFIISDYYFPIAIGRTFEVY